MKKSSYYCCLISMFFLFSYIEAIDDNYYNNKILNGTYNYLPLKIRSNLDKGYYFSGYNKSIDEINDKISFIKTKDKDKWLLESCEAKINEIIFLKNFHPSKSLLSYQLGKLSGYISKATNPFKSKNKLFESFEDEISLKKINILNIIITEIKKEDLINKIEETTNLNLFEAEQLELKHKFSGDINNKKIEEIFSSILNRTINLIINEIHSLFVIFEDKKIEKLTIRDFLPLPKSEKKSTIEKPNTPVPPDKPELKKTDDVKENRK